MTRKTTYIFLLALLSFQFHTVYSQNYLEKWNEGTIELINETSYKVVLRFVSEQTGGLLQVKEKGQEVTLSPNKINSFNFYDPEVDARRNFISVVDFTNGPNRGKRVFVEVLYQGKAISLLQRTQLNGAIITSSLYLKDENSNFIYAYAISRWLRKNQPMYFNPDTKTLYGLTSNHKKQMRSYSNENKLRLRSPEEVISFLRYYDQIDNVFSKR